MSQSVQNHPKLALMYSFKMKYIVYILSFGSLLLFFQNRAIKEKSQVSIAGRVTSTAQSKYIVH